MGQLEKYGLYVLCLVIFLILGVTIWGGGDAPPQRRAPATGLNAAAPATPAGGSAAVRAPAGTGAVPNLQALLQPEARPTTVASRDARPVEASGRPTDTGTLNAGAGNPLAPPAVAAPKEPTEPVAKAPAAPPRPTYKVKPGDTYDGIARAQLGSASLRTEIARLNPGVRPERLQVGTVLVLPAPAELAQAAKPTPGTAPAAVGDARAVVAYTVGRGDTLEGIARRQLGDRKRVDELRELNPDVDPTRLRIGQKIRLPKQ